MEWRVCYVWRSVYQNQFLAQKERSISKQKRTSNAPCALVILDGFGLSQSRVGNAIAHADMPNWAQLQQQYPFTTLAASGHAVGLPAGMNGNSEVGHLTIGAGQIVPSVQHQVATRIAAGTLGQEPAFQELLAALSASGRSLHLVGLLSDGGIHSDHEFAYAFLRVAQRAGVPVFLHAILDGRDVAACSAASFLSAYEQQGGVVASIHGRFYAMDRDEHWGRIARSYTVMTGQAAMRGSWQAVLAQHYESGKNDQSVPPTLLLEKGRMADGDGVLFFNVRPDRARQLTRAFMQPNFDHFKRPSLTLERFLTLGHFDDRFDEWDVVALVTPQLPTTTLLAQLARHHASRRVACIAESEKKAHVTYFFDGRVERVWPQVTHHIIASPAVDSFDQCPAMAAKSLTQRALELLGDNSADMFIINYANADMVGHTGNFEATVKACNVIDRQLFLLHEHIVKRRNGTIIVTADHGNAEQMTFSNGSSCTTHTNNRVPLLVAGAGLPADLLVGVEGLKDVMRVVLQCC